MKRIRNLISIVCDKFTLPFSMRKKRNLQFNIIGKAEPEILNWAKEHSIRLHHIEIVVPFVDTDFSLHVVFFFKKNENLEEYRDTVTEQFKQRYLQILENNDYPREWLDIVSFEFDSDENVQLRYEGNYFFRMR